MSGALKKKKRQSQGLKFNKMNNFTASSKAFLGETDICSSGDDSNY